MKVPVRRHEADLPLPQYKTQGAAALDCVTRDAITIEPGEVGYVRLNVSMQPPAGHFIMMAARSSLHKRGLMMPNGVAVFDEDYCGDGDEYMAILYNFSKSPASIERGERITQIFAVPKVAIEWEEVPSLGLPDRGGMGSTGNH